jgi:tRNA1Val (adenine37-N6)-methyltransferase
VTSSPAHALATTRDALFHGALALTQPADGYRVNVDALLLAAFAAAGRPVRRACDLGAGVGAVGLSLLHLGGADHVTFVEADPFTAELSSSNAKTNGFAARSDVSTCGVREFAGEAQGTYDLVVANPPYVAVGTGRVPQNAARARATVGALDDFVFAARKLTGARGRTCFSYPAQSLGTLFSMLESFGLSPKRARFVHATQGKPARLVLVDAQPGRPGGLTIMPPLLERDAQGVSGELTELFRAPRALRPAR